VCVCPQAGELIPYTEFASSPLCGTANLNEEYFIWLQSGAYRWVMPPGCLDWVWALG
jgi:hypothetical protein